MFITSPRVLTCHLTFQTAVTCSDILAHSRSECSFGSRDAELGFPYVARLALARLPQAAPISVPGGQSRCHGPAWRDPRAMRIGTLSRFDVSKIYPSFPPLGLGEDCRSASLGTDGGRIRRIGRGSPRQDSRRRTANPLDAPRYWRRGVGGSGGLSRRTGTDSPRRAGKSEPREEPGFSPGIPAYPRTPYPRAAALFLAGESRVPEGPHPGSPASSSARRPLAGRAKSYIIARN
jgi:hypothetical protein